MRRRPAVLAWVLAVLAVMLVVLAALLFVRVDRAAERIGQSAREEVARVAADTSAALLTYTPATVAADQYAAAQRLVGEFRERFGRFADTVVIPSARAEGVTSTATVSATGVSALDSDGASALVFLTQVTTSAASPDPVTSNVGARVELRRVNGQWLVSGFETS